MSRYIITDQNEVQDTITKKVISGLTRMEAEVICEALNRASQMGKAA